MIFVADLYPDKLPFCRICPIETTTISQERKKGSQDRLKSIIPVQFTLWYLYVKVM